MTPFILIAAALAGAAILILAWPLVRKQGTQRPWAAASVAVLLPLLAALLYHQFSNFSWDPADLEVAQGGQPSIPQMISRLEHKLKEHPDDAPGWAMLGRSQFVLKNYPGAVEAYEHAYKITGGKDAEIDSSLAEALAMVDKQALSGRAGQLLEEALKADPKNARALWYGGVVAYNAGHPELARERWLAVLDLGPPPEVAQALAEQITRIDREAGRPADARLVALANGAALAGESGGGAVAAAAGTAQAAASPGAGAASGPVVRLTVAIADGLKAKLDGGGMLFVFAQDPNAPGPPLAVKRFPPGQTLPIEVELSTADAMLPSRTLATVKLAKVVARFTKSGQPLAASGDLYGELSYDLSRTDRAQLTIDHVVP